ncbi:MAG: 2-amino-4-hydroxy-6-hydroxymethyldihydropteridine diphosphokinase [Pyrinomonadaceae bacterium]
MELQTTTVYLSIGSNLGDRAGNLLLAVRGLMESGLTVKRLSGIYETSPVDVENQDNYLNMVAEVVLTNITPSQLLARMIRLEFLLGRRHKFTKAPRTVDVDLLTFGSQIVKKEFLKIPHPAMHKRRFVLTPLAELSPQLVIPTFEITVSEMLDALDDDAEVVRWEPYDEGHFNLAAGTSATLIN